MSMSGFLSEETVKLLQSRMEEEDGRLSPYATANGKALRKFERREEKPLRTPFGTDIDKILHNVFYNRYTDKTQVFSFYKNDDITRRALHVQLVARIARILGVALRLNTDLIEAIALGHDIGHTPFGHKGEEYLDALYFGSTGRRFNHNVHSVRVLKLITRSNLTLQTFDGILCHCGEKAFDRYEPSSLEDFGEFEEVFDRCYDEGEPFIKTLRPSTLEGCVVRISDMIAYVGKDRQDAYKALKLDDSSFSAGATVGKRNAEIIETMITDIIDNSIDKPYIKISGDIYEDFVASQKENFEYIYRNDAVNRPYEELIKPMMENMYGQLVDDVKKGVTVSPIFAHHINHIILKGFYKSMYSDTLMESPENIVTDYIASMTDDYFIDLYAKLFPDDTLNGKLEYHPYFE